MFLFYGSDTVFSSIHRIGNPTCAFLLSFFRGTFLSRHINQLYMSTLAIYRVNEHAYPVRIYQVNELRYLAESLHLSFYNRVGIEPTAFQALDGLIPQLSDSQSYYEPSVLVIHMPQHSHTYIRTKNLFINSLEQFKLACGFQYNSN